MAKNKNKRRLTRAERELERAKVKRAFRKSAPQYQQAVDAMNGLAESAERLDEMENDELQDALDLGVGEILTLPLSVRKEIDRKREAVYAAMADLVSYLEDMSEIAQEIAEEKLGAELK